MQQQQQQQQKSLEISTIEYYNIKNFIKGIKYEIKKVSNNLIQIVYPFDEKTENLFKELGF